MFYSTQNGKILKKVIKKAMDTCENSGISIKDWLPDVSKPIKREVNLKLTSLYTLYFI
jgi:hypothetical protein